MTALEFLAQMLEHNVADERGDEGYYKIEAGEDVVESEGHALAVRVGGGELAHEQIGIEQEDDERDLGDGPEDRGQGWTIWGDRLHGVFMVSRSGCCCS